MRHITTRRAALPRSSPAFEAVRSLDASPAGWFLARNAGGARIKDTSLTGHEIILEPHDTIQSRTDTRDVIDFANPTMLRPAFEPAQADDLAQQRFLEKRDTRNPADCGPGASAASRVSREYDCASPATERSTLLKGL